jgi:hypothetical protein
MVRIVGEGSHGWSKGRQINIENKDDNFDVWLKAVEAAQVEICK